MPAELIQPNFGASLAFQKVVEKHQRRQSRVQPIRHFTAVGVEVLESIVIAEHIAETFPRLIAVVDQDNLNLIQVADPDGRCNQRRGSSP